MDYLALSLLLLMLLAASMLQIGLDLADMWHRMSWFTIGLSVLVALTIPNVWMALLFGMVIAGCLTMLPIGEVIKATLLPTTVLAGGYSAAVRWVTPDWVAPAFWLFVLMGLHGGIWAWYSARQTIPYEHPWRTTWLTFFEFTPGHIAGGQGNPNHLQSMAVVSLSAAAGLVWLGQWWAVCAVPVIFQPMWVMRDHWTQGHILSYGVVAGCAMLLIGDWRGWAGLGFAVFGAILYARPWNPRKAWYDSTRLLVWKIAVLEAWWSENLFRKLFGLGTGAWVRQVAGRLQKHFPTTFYQIAHNEFIQQLTEHGLIGAGLLVLYCGDALWRTWHGGVAGQALCLVALSMLSVACVNFPWTWFFEINQRPFALTVIGERPEGVSVRVCQNEPQVKEELNSYPAGCPVQVLAYWPMGPPQPVPPSAWHEPYWFSPRMTGSPALIAMSFAIAVLVEAFP